MSPKDGLHDPHHSSILTVHVVFAVPVATHMLVGLNKLETQQSRVTVAVWPSYRLHNFANAVGGIIFK